MDLPSRLVACLVGLLFMIQGVHCSSKGVTAISIFRPDEPELHKYSAVLAATEPFRLRCDLEIKRAMNPIKHLFYKLRGASLTDPSSIVRIENKAVDIACARYEQRVDEILRWVGVVITIIIPFFQKLAYHDK